MAKKNDKDKEQDVYAKVAAAIGLKGSGSSSTKSATTTTSSKSAASSASSSGKKTTATDYDKIAASMGLTQKASTTDKGAKSSRKDKWDSFWQGIGKNVKAGATDSSLKNQAQYYAHNDPIKEKYRHNTVVNGKESTFTVDQSLNPGYHTSRFLDRALDPQHRVGRESNQGAIYTQEEANRDIQALDEYRARQDVRDYEADVATQQALQTIDPDTKVGQIAVAASMGVARTLPSLAKDAALTATTAGLLGAAGFGKTAIRLAKEIPTLTVRTLRYYDDAFQQAIDNGATEEQAVRAAMQTALPNAAIESAGGLDALAGRMVGVTGKAASKASKATKVLRAAEVPLSEGLEEVAQGIVERGAAARNYDESAVAMDLQQIVNDFALGAAGGAILGSAMGILRRGLNANSQQELEAAMEEQGVPPQTAEQASAAMLDAISKRTAPPTPPTTAEQGMSLMSNAAQATEPATNAERGASLIENSVHDWRAAMQQPEQSKSTNGRLVFSETPTENAGKTALNPEEVQTIAPTPKKAVEPLASAENGTGTQGLRTRGTYGLSVPEGQGKERQIGLVNSLEQGAEAGEVDDQIAEDMRGRTYATVTNEQSLSNGQAAINKYGPQKIHAYLSKVARENNHNFNSTEYAAALQLIKHYSKEGDPESIRAAQDVADIAAMAANDAGRLIQLSKTLAQSSPEVYVKTAEARVKKAGVQLSDSRKAVLYKIADAIKQIEDGTWNGELNFKDIKAIKTGETVNAVANPTEPDVKTDRGLTEWQQAKLDSAEQRIYKQAGLEINEDDSEEVKQEKARAADKRIREKTGVGMAEWLARLGLEEQAMAVRTPLSGRVAAYRRFNMLFNTVSLGVRNPGGNATMTTQEEVVDAPAALFGKFLQLALHGDINSVSFGKLGAYFKGFKQGWVEATTAYRAGLIKLVGHKYGDDTSDLSRLDGGDSRKLSFASAQRTIDDTLSYLLTVFDRCFSKARESQVAAQYEAQNKKANVKTEKAATAYINKSGGEDAVIADLRYRIKNGVQLSREQQIAAAYLAYKTNDPFVAQELQQAAGNKNYYQTETSAKAYIDKAGGEDAVIADLRNRAKNGEGLSREQQLAAAYLASKVEDPAVAQELRQAAGETKLDQGLTEEQQNLSEIAGKTTTYTQDTSGAALATVIRSLGKALEARGDKLEASSGPATKALGKMINGILHLQMPFVQVAGNIVSTIVNYSPAGLLNPALEIVFEWANNPTVNGGGTLKNMSLARQRRIAVGISRALIGSAIIFGGEMLAAAGKATGDAPEKNSLEEKEWTAEGKIGNAIKFGNSWMDLTAVGPAFTLLAIGATIYQETEKELGEQDASSLTYHVLREMVDPLGTTGFIMDNVSDDNLWQGFIDIVGSIGSDEGFDLDEIKDEVFGNMVSQFIPASAMLRRFAYAIDPYVRETSGADDEEWRTNKTASGLPSFIPRTPISGDKINTDLPEKKDVQGKSVTRYPNADTGLKRWLSAFLNPASRISEDKSNDPVTQALIDLAEETDKKSILPKTAPYTLAGEDGKYKLYGEERSLYQETLGTKYHECMTELFGDKYFNSLSSDEQAKLAAKVMTLAEYEAQKDVDEISPDYTIKSDSDQAELGAKVDAAAEKGIDAPTYLLYSAVTKDCSFKDANGKTISLGQKKGVAETIKQKFDNLTPDQQYYLWMYYQGLNDPYADQKTSTNKYGVTRVISSKQYYNYFHNIDDDGDEYYWTHDDLMGINY